MYNNSLWKPGSISFFKAIWASSTSNTKEMNNAVTILYSFSVIPQKVTTSSIIPKEICSKLFQDKNNSSDRKKTERNHCNSPRNCCTPEIVASVQEFLRTSVSPQWQYIYAIGWNFTLSSRLRSDWLGYIYFFGYLR